MHSDLQEAVLRAVKAKFAFQCSPHAPALNVEVAGMPHRGQLFIDVSPTGEQVLTHMATHEHATLPPSAGSWSLMLDEGGFAAVVSDDDSQDPICAEELLNMTAWQSDPGEKYVVAERGAMKGATVKWAAIQSKHSEVELGLRVGVRNAKVLLKAWALKWPRPPAGRLYVSLKSLCEVLGLDQFNHQWWRWSWAGMPRWQKRLSEYGLQEHLLLSIRCQVVSVWSCPQPPSQCDAGCASQSVV